jgi:hypothetical protein
VVSSERRSREGEAVRAPILQDHSGRFVAFRSHSWPSPALPFQSGTRHYSSVVSWSEYQHEFGKDEGDLRDIYVDGLGPADWERAYEFVTSTYECFFEWDSEEAPLPASVAEIQLRSQQQAPRLYVKADGVELHWNFFSPHSQLELDLVASQVRSEGAFQALVRFLQALAGALAKPARLTFEGSPELVILEVAPGQGSS